MSTNQSPSFVAPPPAQITPLAIAAAKAQNTNKMLEVVDESLRRSAEMREKREKIEAERREKEERDNRVDDAEEREAESARRLTERNEREAEEIAARDAARSAAQRAIAGGDLWPLNVVI